MATNRILTDSRTGDQPPRSEQLKQFVADLDYPGLVSLAAWMYSRLLVSAPTLEAELSVHLRRAIAENPAALGEALGELAVLVVERGVGR